MKFGEDMANHLYSVDRAVEDGIFVFYRDAFRNNRPFNCEMCFDIGSKDKLCGNCMREFRAITPIGDRWVEGRAVCFDPIFICKLMGGGHGKEIEDPSLEATHGQRLRYVHVEFGRDAYGEVVRSFGVREEGRQGALMQCLNVASLGLVNEEQLRLIKEIRGRTVFAADLSVAERTANRMKVFAPESDV